MVRLRLPWLLCAALTAAGAAEPLPAFEARWTAESWKLPSNEPRMGMAGLQVHRVWASGAYGGFGTWGSLTGLRGGFITVGLSGGWRWPLTERLALDGGLWAGGGGAGRAAVGGGLQVRGHAGLSWDAGWGRLGLEASRVRFPNGRIDSGQVAATAVLPFAVPVNLPSSGPGAWGGGFQEVVLLAGAQRYTPAPSARVLAGPQRAAPLDLPAFEARVGLGGGAFLDMDMAAAARGQADGYMDIFLGLGWATALAPGLSGVVRVGAGPAGGGNLDVGGGAAFKAMAGLEAGTGRGLLVSLQGGYVATPAATFKARVLSLSAGRRYGLAMPGGEGTPDPGGWQDSGWSFRPSFLRMAHPQRSGSGEGPDLEFVGLQFGHDLGGGLELLGQANFATAGRAGGFAQGLVGAAWRSPALAGAGPRLRLQALAGAAGGGGVDTGGGLCVQPSAGLEQALAGGWNLQVLAGRVRAPKGGLDAATLEAGLAWRFTVPERR